jgi:hypothetical protein
MPTGMSSGFAGAVGPMADMSISERPVTQQGLSGMRPVTSGPGRMVQDASFFVGLLRQKINEITVEIGRMRSDADKAAKDSAVLVQYERKYDVLIKEVRGLEGDLADYNLAMDKSRTSMVRWGAPWLSAALHPYVAAVDRDCVATSVRAALQRAADEVSCGLSLRHRNGEAVGADEALQRAADLPAGIVC